MSDADLQEQERDKPFQKRRGSPNVQVLKHGDKNDQHGHHALQVERSGEHDGGAKEQKARHQHKKGPIIIAEQKGDGQNVQRVRQHEEQMMRGGAAVAVVPALCGAGGVGQHAAGKVDGEGDEDDGAKRGVQKGGVERAVAQQHGEAHSWNELKKELCGGGAGADEAIKNAGGAGSGDGR